MRRPKDSGSARITHSIAGAAEACIGALTCHWLAASATISRATYRPFFSLF
jgi:hypothetical protein